MSNTRGFGQQINGNPAVFHGKTFHSGKTIGIFPSMNYILN